MKIETPVLNRLGPVPFWRGEQKCLAALESIYRKVRESAVRQLDLPPDPISRKSGTRPSGGNLV